MEKYDSIPSLGEQQTSSRVFTCLVVFVEMVSLAVVVMVGVWIGRDRGGFAWHDDVAKEFNYHPLFMILGLIFLYGNAMLVYRVFRNEYKLRLKILHAVLLALSLIISAVGLKAVYDSHTLAPTPQPNFYTLHSWIGLVTMILFGIQWLVGFGSFLLPFCGQSVRAFVLPIHTFFGVVIFCFAVATAMMGITEKLIWTLDEEYSKFVSEGLLMNSVGLLLIILVVAVVFIVTNPNYKRQPLPDEEVIPLTN